MTDKRIYIYDCTLRDGAQTQGVDFNAIDKGLIAKQLDLLGVDYIEGGWPGANPTDDAFFASPPTLTRSRLTAFGMTRRAGRSSDNDPGLNALLDCGTEAICMVGKTWDFHVDMALNIEHKENITMIADSIAHATTKVKEVIFDAEHFFDGYKANPEFALACLEAAHNAGGRWIVLCDTNGGPLPSATVMYSSPSTVSLTVASDIMISSPLAFQRRSSRTLKLLQRKYSGTLPRARRAKS